MKINTKIRYGLRMLLMLAREQSVINTSELGKKMNVSPKYLRKLAGPMEKGELIRSVQGIYGGYTLNKAPGDINLLMLFDAFEEEIKLSQCMNGDHCSLFDECDARSVWTRLGANLKNEFSGMTLEDILNDAGNSLIK